MKKTSETKFQILHCDTFNINYMLKEFEEKYSKTYKLFQDLPKIGEENFNEKTKEIYCQAEEISVDYAIMEKSDAIYVIPGDFGWDDIGTWLALQRYIKPDENNNYIRGKVRAIKGDGEAYSMWTEEDTISCNVLFH